jgi:hypothetical protein
MADALAWAEAHNSNRQGGDFMVPSELAGDGEPDPFIQPPQSLEEVTILLGRKETTETDQDDFLLASQQDAPSPVIPVSNACVAISPVGNLGTLYLGIPRVNGSCKVDLNEVGFYLNDPTCTKSDLCGENLNRGIECRYPSPRALDCENEDATGPCIDYSDVEAAVNVICAPDNAACNECINWQTGSPSCTDFRTDGYRIKMCILEDSGKTCSWKKCCKKKKKIEACGYPE